MNCLRIVVCRSQAGQRGVVRIDSPQRGDRPARTHGEPFSPHQADESGGAFAHRSPEELKPEVRDCNAVPARLRSAWMRCILRLCPKLRAVSKLHPTGAWKITMDACRYVSIAYYEFLFSRRMVLNDMRPLLMASRMRL